jgi:3-methyladenine DNA glycosylase AlkD
VFEGQIERWVAGVDSWELCDQVCGLFEQMSFARQNVVEWSGRDDEFVKRAAFAIVAGLAVHDKRTPDSDFDAFFPLLLEQATDPHNFVKKAVNWALRNVGKRNLSLNQRAIEVAEQLEGSPGTSAHWIGRDAWRELTSEKDQVRIRGR